MYWDCAGRDFNYPAWPLCHKDISNPALNKASFGILVIVNEKDKVNLNMAFGEGWKLEWERYKCRTNFDVAKLSPPEGSLHVASPEQGLVWVTLKITAMPEQSVWASPATMEEEGTISLSFRLLLSFCPSTIRLALCIGCRSLSLDRAGLLFITSQLPFLPHTEYHTVWPILQL